MSNAAPAPPPLLSTPSYTGGSLDASAASAGGGSGVEGGGSSAAADGGEETKLVLDGKEANFADHLWDGFDAVFTRLTQGRHDLKTIKAYMSERAEAEQKYAAALKKASEIPDMEENCTLSSCWRDLKKSSLSFAKQHESLGVICTEIAAALERAIVDVKALKTKLHKRNEEIVADREKKRTQWEKARKEYAEKVKAAESAVASKDAAKSNEKLYKKETLRATAALKDADGAHLLYKKAVEIYFESQKAYDTGIVDIMMQCERAERARLATLATQLQRFSQSQEFLRNAMDQIALFISKGMQGINIAKDLNEFIKAHYTAARHPPYVQYEPIRSAVVEKELKTNAAALAPQLLAASAAGADAGIAVPNAGQFAAPAAAPSAPSLTSPLAPSAPAAPPAPPMIGSPPPGPPPSAAATAATLAAASSATSPKPPAMPPTRAAPATAVALYDFSSSEADDLTFKSGDVIVLLSSPDGEDWWQGEIKGRVGMFPRTYVEKRGDQTPHCASRCVRIKFKLILCALVRVSVGV
jgi:hypothetical protein